MPFVKGKSGNPAGRPKDTLGNFLRDKKKLPQEIYDAVYPLLKDSDKAIRIKAAEFLSDRRDGKPSQLLGSDPENPLPSGIVVLPAQDIGERGKVEKR